MQPARKAVGTSDAAASELSSLDSDLLRDLLQPWQQSRGEEEDTFGGMSSTDGVRLKNGLQAQQSSECRSTQTDMEGVHVQPVNAAQAGWPDTGSVIEDDRAQPEQASGECAMNTPGQE
jgi:hypothetical protein